MNTLARKLARLCLAIKTCKASENVEWKLKHESKLAYLVREYMPSGCGFDNGTKIIVEESNEQQLVFHTSFHHIGEVGNYFEWTEHRVVVRASFLGLGIIVSGRDKNDIKEYIMEMFLGALDSEIPEDQS